MQKTRVAGALSEEQLARCAAKAKANNSTLQQEILLASGVTVQELYHVPWPDPEPYVARLLKGEALDVTTKVIAYRMVSELMAEFGTALKRKEIVALCGAARIIAQEPYEAERNRLEKLAVDRAFAMVVDGE